MSRASWLLFLLGIASLWLGRVYVRHAFGPTEAEVVTWGEVSIGLGIALGIFGIVFAGGVLDRLWIPAVVLCGGLAALQVLPISLWFTFHGSGISDGTPPSTFVAHWSYAIPHIGLLAGSAGAVCYLLRTRSKTVQGTKGDPAA